MAGLALGVPRLSTPAGTWLAPRPRRTVFLSCPLGLAGGGAGWLRHGCRPDPGAPVAVGVPGLRSDVLGRHVDLAVVVLRHGVVAVPALAGGERRVAGEVVQRVDAVRGDVHVAGRPAGPVELHVAGTRVAAGAGEGEIHVTSPAGVHADH